jgi:hypothetical protein
LGVTVHVQIPCGVDQVVIVRMVIVHILESSAVLVRTQVNGIDLVYTALLDVRKAATDAARSMLGNIYLYGVLRVAECHVRLCFSEGVLLENFFEDLNFALATAFELAYQTHATLKKRSEGMETRRSVHAD